MCDFVRCRASEGSFQAPSMHFVSSLLNAGGGNEASKVRALSPSLPTSRAEPSERGTGSRFCGARLIPSSVQVGQGSGWLLTTVRSAETQEEALGLTARAASTTDGVCSCDSR